MPRRFSLPMRAAGLAGGVARAGKKGGGGPAAARGNPRRERILRTALLPRRPQRTPFRRPRTALWQEWPNVFKAGPRCAPARFGRASLSKRFDAAIETYLRNGRGRASILCLDGVAYDTRKPTVAVRARCRRPQKLSVAGQCFAERATTDVSWQGNPGPRLKYSTAFHYKPRRPAGDSPPLPTARSSCLPNSQRLEQQNRPTSGRRQHIRNIRGEIAAKLGDDAASLSTARLASNTAIPVSADLRRSLRSRSLTRHVSGPRLRSERESSYRQHHTTTQTCRLGGWSSLKPQAAPSHTERAPT